jgi:CheY-like chemotaxis protein
MEENQYKLLLADDDADDCIFFQEALEDLPVSTSLQTVSDGVELMDFLSAYSGDLPDMLFLDLNMPLKNGFDCLSEVKNDTRLKALPVIIFSTSLDMEVVSSLYEKGADYYIRKPSEFSRLKQVIHEAINAIGRTYNGQPDREHFILEP